MIDFRNFDGHQTDTAAWQDRLREKNRRRTNRVRPKHTVQQK
jgi:hypothetical protein